MLYTLATEALLGAIRNSRNINGFLSPDNNETKVKGYADDTAVYVRDMQFIQHTLQLIERFGLASESKININKTFILLSGTLIVEKPINYDLNYVTDQIKMLGVWVGNNDTTETNWTPVVNKKSKILILWSSRQLTIKGKSVNVNTLALSKVWYLASVCVPPDHIYEKIEDAIHKEKEYKINKKDTLHIPDIYGGISCVNVRLETRSLRIKWLVKITSEQN